MLMMLVVHVQMLVLHGFVHVLVVMILGEM